MPITSPASYLPTVALFLAHWEEVDGILGEGHELQVGREGVTQGVPDALGRADLVQLSEDLTAVRAAVTAEAVALSLARTELREGMAAALGRCRQFAAGVRARYNGYAFARALPGVPGLRDAPEIFLKRMDKAVALWLVINAAPGSTPLTLGTGTEEDPAYEAGHFAADIAALRAAAREVVWAEQRLKIQIELRTEVQSAIEPVLRDYRRAVAGRFSVNHAMVKSLPLFRPVPGVRPAPPVLDSVVWNEGAQQAEARFTPAGSPGVVRHELRVCPGGKYDEQLEVIAGALAAGQPPVFQTAALLATPGAIISVKIVAITEDGQEKASNMLSLQRPAPL